MASLREERGLHRKVSTRGDSGVVVRSFLIEGSDQPSVGINIAEFVVRPSISSLLMLLFMRSPFHILMHIES